MRERIVYILGAGFSAPLGLPVMSNFLLRSKDLYFSDPKRYPGFKKVLARVDSMAKAKNYYSVDLFNIEEILSILEMERHAGGMRAEKAYKEYLRDVILALTPGFPPQSEHEAWPEFLPTTARLGTDYAAFVATLFKVEWERAEDQSGRWFSARHLDTGPTYSVVTLNYDLVLENSLELLNKVVTKNSMRLEFGKSVEEMSDQNRVALSKLHGSVAPLSLVPPTWNKTRGRGDVPAAWKLAYSELSKATQIRFVGYSLPAGDRYVQYLLESAVLKSEHLKAIDVICLDPTGEVEGRYRDMVTYSRFRFVPGDAKSYLQRNRDHTKRRIRQIGNRRIRKLDRLEECHEEFMKQDP